MSTIIEFLQKGVEAFEGLPKDEIDQLHSNVRQCFASGNRSRELLDTLIGDTGYYYAMLGNKLAQITAIKASLARQVERNRLRIAKDANISPKEKAQTERLALQDEGHEKLQSQYDLIVGLEKFLSSARESLFMEHYALRNLTGDGAINRRINH